MTIARHGSLRSTILLCAALAAAYVLLGRLTFAVSVEYGNVTSVVFVPEGVALAFCVLFGARVAPGILIGQIILSAWSGPSLLGGFAIGLVNSFEGVLGAWLFQHWKISHGFDRPRDVALFAVTVMVVLQPISATGGVAVLYLLGVIPPSLIPTDWAPWWIQGLQKPLPSLSLVPSAWVHWWIGNSVGQLLVAPLMLSWLQPAKPMPRSGVLDLLVSLAGMVVVLLLVLGWIPGDPLVLLAVTYPLLVWIGLRRGIRGISLANVLIVAAVTWAGASGEGFMSHLSVADRLSYVGFFVLTACFFSLMLFAMFEERRVLIDRLTQLASTDPLVPLSNRRHFMEVASREIEKSRRHSRPLALLMLDIDHFKRVNDEHGHATGDRALKAVAGCCAAVARKTDLAGRIGGEEFALLLPETTREGGKILAERLRECVADAVVALDSGERLSLTVSVGVATLAAHGGVDAVLAAADEAMYRAKQGGRNRVCLAPD